MSHVALQGPLYPPGYHPLLPDPRAAARTLTHLGLHPGLYTTSALQDLQTPEAQGV